MKERGRARLKGRKGDMILVGLFGILAGLLISFLIPGVSKWTGGLLREHMGSVIFILLLSFVAALLIQFEERKISSWELALVGIMGAFSAAARIPFAVIPSVQPCTVIILSVGLVFGWRIGFLVGVVTSLVSNFFLPLGPWAIWQMFAWGLGGMVAGATGRLLPRAGVPTLLVLGVLWGIVYGIIIDIYTLGIFLSAGDALSLATIAKTYLPALPFNMLHITGNVVFALALGPSLLWVERRFRDRYGWQYGPERADKRGGRGTV